MVRKILFAITLLTVLVGCKSTQVSFSAEDITPAYIKKLLVIANENDTSFSSGNIFVADLEEDLVNRDGIAEETIINSKSAKPRSGVTIDGNSYQLFIITVDNEKNRSIFLPAIFNSEEECIGLGPALVGDWGAGQLKFTKRLRCEPNRKTHEAIWKYPVKENEYGKSKRSTDPDDKTITKLEIKFETNSAKKIPTLADFRIINIYTISPNRFGGNKPLVFNIENIFEDDQALYFKHLKTF